jgi:hypothetical protein
MVQSDPLWLVWPVSEAIDATSTISKARFVLEFMSLA